MTVHVPVTFTEQITHSCTWENDRPYRKDIAPGSVAWSADHAGLHVVCPCGCGSLHYLPVARDQRDGHNWIWDGNSTSPTFKPSIQMTSPCRWHGFLENGVFHD